MLDALAGLALLGLLAVGVLSMLHLSVHMMQQAARLDRAREAAQSIVARCDAVSWARLPEFFHATPDRSRAWLDTTDGTAPIAWQRLIDTLPGGRIRACLEGLGPQGRPADFGRALALRLRVELLFDGGPRERRLELSSVRF